MIKGYDIVERKDRQDTGGGRGGGIMVYAKLSMYVWSVEVNTTFNQCAAVNIKLEKKELAVLIIYRSPNSNKDNDDKLCNWVKEISGQCILIGDFNYPGIDWSNGRSDAKGRAFYETIQDKFMEQQIDDGTHVSGHTLDLILTNENELVRDVKTDGIRPLQ